MLPLRKALIALCGTVLVLFCIWFTTARLNPEYTSALFRPPFVKASFVVAAEATTAPSIQIPKVLEGRVVKTSPAAGHTMPSPPPPIPSELLGSLDVANASAVDFSAWLWLSSRGCGKDGDAKTVRFRYMDVKLTCAKASEHCPVWFWDVANWTLIYTKENLFQSTTSSEAFRFCPTPVRGERTEKIIQSDGKVEYNYCPDSRYPCAPWALLAAHWDSKLKRRINSSPCCRKQIMDVTKHMARVFDEHNITYLHVGGTVIGLVRDGGEYVPYDTDTDFGVDVNDYDKLVKAIPDLQKTGYIFKFYYTEKDPKDGKHWYMVGCANSHCHTGPGIGLYKTVGDYIDAPVPPWRLPKSISVPPIRRMFEGMEMSFPREPEKYLDLIYGKDKWRTPLKCDKHYYSQCKA